MNFTVAIVSLNLANTSNFVEFRDSRNWHIFRGIAFGCRKTICDVTKVTYNMYSWVISCMSREVTEMDGRDYDTSIPGGSLITRQPAEYS